MPSLWAVLGLMLLGGVGVCAAAWYGLLPPLASFVGSGLLAIYPAFSIGIRSGHHGGYYGFAVWVAILLVVGAVVYFHFTGFG